MEQRIVYDITIAVVYEIIVGTMLVGIIPSNVSFAFAGSGTSRDELAVSIGKKQAVSQLA